MHLIFAAAGLAELSRAEARDFEFTLFLIGATPLAVYTFCAFGLWVFIHVRWLRRRRELRKSLLVLVFLLSIGLPLVVPVIMLWPYWWWP